MTNIPRFIEMYNMVPHEIKVLLDRCADTPQGTDYHPEGDVLRHTRIVYERTRKYGDMNIALAAIFHDLGKVTTTEPNGRGGWSAHGHDKISTDLVVKHKKWIGSIGGRFMRVKEIVENHMRIKVLDEMRAAKRRALMVHRCYPALLVFTECDDMTTLREEEWKL